MREYVIETIKKNGLFKDEVDILTILHLKLRETEDFLETTICPQPTDKKTRDVLRKISERNLLSDILREIYSKPKA